MVRWGHVKNEEQISIRLRLVHAAMRIIGDRKPGYVGFVEKLGYPGRRGQYVAP